MTTDGFFSAVQDRDDHGVMVGRAQGRNDADELAAVVDGAVLETPDADYLFRVRVAKDVWSAMSPAAQRRSTTTTSRTPSPPDRAGRGAYACTGEVWSRCCDYNGESDVAVWCELL